jgi:acetoin utilization protein AcuB
MARTVETVMRTAPVTIGPNETLAAAKALMDREGFRQLPVVEQGKLVGMLSDRDLHAHVGYFERTKVDAAMTPSPLTAGPTEAAERVARLLTERRINALPVVDNDRLIGIVSKTDLLRLLIDLLQSEASEPPG